MSKDDARFRFASLLGGSVGCGGGKYKHHHSWILQFENRMIAVL